jgi:enoyl-CoA hydratase/carnithine racemase
MTIQVQEQSRHVVLMTIDHQPHRNAMTRPMLAELARLWDTFERASYRCIILTGAGEQAFCAGADMSGDLSVDVETVNVVNHALLKAPPLFQAHHRRGQRRLRGRGPRAAPRDRHPGHSPPGPFRAAGGALVDLPLRRGDR